MTIKQNAPLKINKKKEIDRHNEAITESALFKKYGTKICSYIWWAREAKIELTIQR